MVADVCAHRELVVESNGIAWIELRSDGDAIRGVFFEFVSYLWNDHLIRSCNHE